MVGPDHVASIEAEQADDADSALGKDWQSETTSLSSTLYRGYIEHGRRYQTLREGQYWGPSDEQQFETMEAGHVLYSVLDSQEPNHLFHAPVENLRQVLDLGTGQGSWAIDVADKFPSAQVHGIDLYPPPQPWVPPNCVLEVDDILESWTYREKFDLIHMRLLLGAFTPEQWDDVYKKCFQFLQPGGWIEQVELDVRVASDDGTLPESSYLHGWGPNFLGCGERCGRPLDTQETMRVAIEKAGFVNAQEKLYKCPIGPWPKHPLLKDAGRINRGHWSAGLDGWAMFLLTRFGAPQPWDANEVRIYVAKVRGELKNPRWHIYHLTRRVWAQKPKD